MLKSFYFFCILSFSIVVSLGGVWSPIAVAQDGSIEILLPTKDPTKFKVDYRLAALNGDFAGDHIDIDTGRLSFSYTDVSLPGNFDIPVIFSRYMTSGNLRFHTNQNLGDWRVNVPQISTNVYKYGFSPNSPTHAGWHQDRCTGSMYPPDFTYHEVYHTFSGSIVDSKTTGGWDTYGGLRLSVPGKTSSSLLNVDGEPTYPTPETINFGGSPRYVTKDFWKVSCLPGAASDGGDGFLVTAPNGDKYTFDTLRYQEVYLDYGDYGSGYFEPDVGTLGADTEATMFVSKIEDVHGNWVTYSYNNSGPTQITSSDNRSILISYNGSLVSQVSANGRIWNYEYTGERLTKVTQPDGYSWNYDLNILAPQDECYSMPPDPSVVMHPNGATVTFELEQVSNGIKGSGWNDPIPNPAGLDIDYLPGCHGEYAQSPSFSVNYAVTKKTITHDGGSPEEWVYEYDQDWGSYTAGSPGSLNGFINEPSSLSPTKKRTIVNPVGVRKEVYVNRETGWRSGLIEKEEIFSTPSSSLPVQTTVYTYQKGPLIGTRRFEHANDVDPELYGIHQTKKTVSRDGDLYSTELDYNFDGASTVFSYGYSTQTRTYSNISTSPRIVDVTYEHNTTKWILDLPKTITQNGRLTSEYIYDASTGQIVQANKYGALQAKFGYNADGTLDRFEDALTPPRRTLAQLWKRGMPQKVVRPDGSFFEKIVDDNGWVTSATDAKNATTVFGHNAMGWVTSVDLPGSIFNTTNINYVYGASDFGGVLQTLSKGSATTEVHHDVMNRPRRTDQYTTGWSSVSETTYDGLGRVTYQSRPFEMGGVSAGTNTYYDGLGRVTRVEDTTNPTSLYSTYTYTSYNRTRVDNPDGRYSVTWRDGYSGPGNGEVKQIDELGVSGYQRSTYLYRNDLDNLTWLRQIDFTGTTPKEISQHFVYDAQQRLCADHVPEHGEARYTYNAAGQLITYAKGLNRTAYSGVTSCAGTAGATSLVTLGYDALGRVLTKDFADAATLDVENVYDANGNLTRSLRRPLGGTISNEFYRTYDELNNILTEQQIVVGAPTSLNLGYEYDANGFMDERRYPSGMTQTWTNDGFGHQQNLAQGNYSYASNITYHPDGSLKSYAAGNGQAFTRNLDALQRTQQLKSAGAITALDLTYAYDTSSRITSIMDGSTPGANAAGKTHAVANLQYDALGHMTHADGWWRTGTFEYDGFGNLGRRWLSESGANPRRIWNFYDANNRLFVTDDSLPTASGGASWHSHSYDDRGNITRSGSSANNQHTMFMAYDMSDQMVGMSGHNLQEAPLTATYQYNGAGKRVHTNHNGRESYPMYDAGGALRSVYKVNDGELVEQISLQSGHPLAKWTGSTLTYLHADHLGTPIRGTHGLGGTGLTPGAEVFQDFATPYGLNPTPQWHGNGGSGFDPATGQGSNCGVTGFTTHAKDCESGLTHMQARQYSPVSGRFLSVDPVGFADTGNPGMFNRYSYSFNDPINLVDPTGMSPELYALARVSGRSQLTSSQRAGVHKGEVLGAKIGVAVASVFVPGPEDIVIAGALATKAGQAVKTALGAKKALTCCFVAGTLVETEDGLRPIEEIAVGDFVLSKDEETGETDYKPVLGLIRLHDRIIWDLETVSETGETRTFRTTDDHPWWVEGHGWKRTDELSSKDILATQTELKVSVFSVKNTERIEPTFNFEVADFNTYFVGESKVWVHNSACDLGSAGGSRAGKKHTRAAVRDEIAANAKVNGGTTQCVTCKVETTLTTRRTKGSTVATTEGQGAHIKARANGGNGATVGDRSNVAIQCASCNNKTRTDDVDFN